MFIRRKSRSRQQRSATLSLMLFHKIMPFAAGIVLFSLTQSTSAAPPNTAARAQELIRVLGLKRLPRESGYLGIVGVSDQKVIVKHRSLAVQSQNYYMLTDDLPINYLHWLEPADTHILIEGGPVDYFLFHPDGRVEQVTLGADVSQGQRPIVAVPGNCWKALKLHKGAHYALMANALSPEFTPDRVRIGEGPAWVARYQGKASWATPQFLRELIGPNYQAK